MHWCVTGPAFSFGTTTRWLWRDDGQVVPVGMATRLRNHACNKDLGPGVSIFGSLLRRNVCGLLFGSRQTPPDGPTKQTVTTEQTIDPRLAARL